MLIHMQLSSRVWTNWNLMQIFGNKMAKKQIIHNFMHNTKLPWRLPK